MITKLNRQTGVVKVQRVNAIPTKSPSLAVSMHANILSTPPWSIRLNKEIYSQPISDKSKDQGQISEHIPSACIR